MKTNQENQNALFYSKTQQVLQALLLPLFLMLVSTGCKQNPGVTSGMDLAGTYTLISVDGKTVPCAIKHDAATLTIKSGTFVIGDDGTCSSRIAFSKPSGGESSREVKATYTRAGSKLTMRWQGAGTTTGTVQGNTFTMNNEGMVFAYSK